MTSILEKIRNDAVDYREADEGVVNSTYILDDSVIQKPEHGNGGRLRKNKTMMKKIRSEGGPVPEILEYSEDPFYVVYERIEGTLLEDREEFNKSGYLKAIKGAGRALAKIHQTEGVGYGKPGREDLETGEFEEWKEFVEEYSRGAVSYAESELFESIAEKAADILEIDSLPDSPVSRILHMDYTPDNIIIDEDFEATVIDFDGAYYGDPRLDLMYAKLIMSKRDEEIAEAFMDGYRDEREPELTEDLERNYTALAVLRDVRGGEWCLRNDKDVDLEEWSQGLESVLEGLE